MPREVYTPEQIRNKHREAKILLSQVNAMGIVCTKLGTNDLTNYRCRAQYGGTYCVAI